MRLLHTSDWHLGASLEGFSREADHAAFLEWLAQTLEREQVDVLVVAGDVFDQAHPSSEAQRLYYRFLRRISGRVVRKVVVVGGNHDSAARLDAPRELLSALDVHVVGGLSEDALDRCLCPVADPNGGVGAVVLAVPFVHEYRLGLRTSLSSPSELAAAFRERFAAFYTEQVDRARALHDGAPVVATGHLTCIGYESGDFPVDVHRVGTIGGLPPEIFDPRLQYVALGHIHRSYRVGQSRAYYSGSPIPLCLQEWRRARQVRIVETSDAPGSEASVRTLEVPQARNVLELRGSSEAVRAQLAALTWSTPLPPLVYAVVEVPHWTPGLEDEVRAVVAGRAPEASPLLVQIRQVRPEVTALPNARPSHVSLRDLHEEEVFLRLCQERGENPDPQLLDAFRSLLSSEAERGAA